MASGCAPGLIRLRRCASPQLHDPGWPWVPALFVVSVVVMSALTVVLKPVEAPWDWPLCCPVGWHGILHLTDADFRLMLRT